MSEWISIRDKLPEKDLHVWCFCFEDHQQQARYTDSKDWGEEGMSHHFRNLWDSYVIVTHWMPLPDPPEIVWSEQNSELVGIRHCGYILWWLRYWNALYDGHTDWVAGCVDCSCFSRSILGLGTAYGASLEVNCPLCYLKLRAKLVDGVWKIFCKCGWHERS